MAAGLMLAVRLLLFSLSRAPLPEEELLPLLLPMLREVERPAKDLLGVPPTLVLLEKEDPAAGATRAAPPAPFPPARAATGS